MKLDQRPAGAGYVILASIFLNFLGLALPLALLQIYDRIIPNSSHGTLALLLAGVATAVMLEALLRVVRADVIGWMGAQFEHRAGCDAFRHVMGAPVDELERVGPGEVIERMSGLPTVREVFAEHWMLVLCDLPFVLLFLGLIAYLAGWVVLAPVAVLLLFVAFAAVTHDAHRKAILDFNQVRDRRQNFGIEVIHGIHSIKAMAMEAQMAQRYARLQEAVARHSHRVVLLNSNAQGVGGIFSQLVTMSVVVAGGLMVVDNALTVGGLSACMLLAGRALQPVQRAVSLWSRWESARIMRDRFATVFELPSEPRAAKPVASLISGRIAFEGVGLRAGGDGDTLFSNLDLSVAPGERLAIGGDNGSGKSTLIRLIHGSLPPSEGRILLDGIPVGEYDRDTLLRSHGIAMVPQRGELLRGTVLENMTMFRRERRKIALDLASALGLDDVIYRLANGYNTRVGDGATDLLSRGAVQRVAVVRALASQPRILLFDEANAAMDGPGDEKLRHLFERLPKDMTLVMVTLRPSLQKIADRVLRIEGGRLVPVPPTPQAVPPRREAAAAAE